MQHYKQYLPSEIYLIKIQNQNTNFKNHCVVSFPHPDVNLYTSECAASMSSLNRITQAALTMLEDLYETYVICDGGFTGKVIH